MSFRMVEHPGGDPRAPWTMVEAGTVSVVFGEDSPLVIHGEIVTKPILPVMDWLFENAFNRYRLTPVRTSASVPAIVFRDYATAFAFKMRWDGARAG